MEKIKTVNLIVNFTELWEDRFAKVSYDMYLDSIQTGDIKEHNYDNNAYMYSEGHPSALVAIKSGKYPVSQPLSIR